MPRISEFFGMVVYKYWFDTQKHERPHFHARYQGLEAVFALEGAVLEGDLGPRAHRLVIEWAEQRRSEIADAWALASAGKELPCVLPLR